MKFRNVIALRTPGGDVARIRYMYDTLWEKAQILARYVSLGDSIAAGHAIDTDWEKNYGYDSQYGANGNTSTVIVPGCYTDLIRKELEDTYGSDRVLTVSFARSGDTVADLMGKLDHETVRSAIRGASLVTICIGANDVLQPALHNLDEYINSGDLSGITAIVQANLVKLADDSNSNSYKALLDKLTGINPKATYVFTSVYNPYKYLWLEESTRENDFKDGFLGPLMWAIPDVVGDSVANSIRNAFVNTDVVEMLFDRVNGINTWSETQVTALNEVLKSKVAACGNSNILVADTKAVYDYVPDRPVFAPKHYNDLVSVEPTRGYVVEDLDWGQFWANVDWISALSNIENIASEVINNVLNYVILPDVDPHPEEYGHYALKRSFEDALGWAALARHTVTFHANGGTGTMAAQVVTALDGMAAYVTLGDSGFGVPGSGYRFAGWNTAANGSGTAYAVGQVAAITGDTTLYAQWSSSCTLRVNNSMGDVLPLYGNGDTGPMDYYAYAINGAMQDKLGAFSNPARVHTLPVGTEIMVAVNEESGSDRAYITLNGSRVPTVSGYDFPVYAFTLTGDAEINFEWNCWYEGLSYQSYWNCYITTH